MFALVLKFSPKVFVLGKKLLPFRNNCTCFWQKIMQIRLLTIQSFSHLILSPKYKKPQKI